MSDYEIVLDKSDIDELMENGYIKAVDDGTCICVFLANEQYVAYKDKMSNNEKHLDDLHSRIERLVSANNKIRTELFKVKENRNDALDEVAKLRRKVEQLTKSKEEIIAEGTIRWRSLYYGLLSKYDDLKEENKRLQFVCEGHANTIRRLLEVDWKKSYHALSERVEELTAQNKSIEALLRDVDALNKEPYTQQTIFGIPYNPPSRPAGELLKEKIKILEDAVDHWQSQYYETEVDNDNLNRKLDASDDAVEYYKQEHSKLCEVYSKSSARVGELEKENHILIEEKKILRSIIKESGIVSSYFYSCSFE